MSEKKKVFPKLKKKLQDFLTDESGEITKKDALGIAAGAALLGLSDSVSADTQKQVKISSNSPESVGFCTVDITAKHVSGVVNGHISKNPEIKYSSAHISSHSSHNSGGWC